MAYNLTELLAESLENGRNPRVHPNGFIQLDLAPVEGDWHASHQRGHSGSARRLHIWNPPGIELPHQDTVNEIHDHVFDMKSSVVRGYLVQRLYEFVEPSSPGMPHPHLTHERYRAIYQKGADSRLEATGERGWLKAVESFGVLAGFTYTQPAFTLHDTETPRGLCVTVMEKTRIHEGDATVICPIDQPPDNSFDRATAMDENEIWEAIERSLKS